MIKSWGKKEAITVCWFVCCFVLAVIVRVYKLGDIPYGLHVDEAGMGYDAWLLQRYHMDRWQNQLPVYLINYGGGQSALYAYLCAAFIKLLGDGESWNILWMRLPGVVVNLMAYIAGVQIIGKIFQKKWKMISAILLAVLPYFVMQCRFGLDCNLLVNMLTISLYILFLAVEYQRTWIFLLAGVLYGLTYYSYVLSYVPNTLLLLFITYYLLSKDRRYWKNLLCVWVVVVVIAFPLVLMIIINQFELPELILGVFTIPRLPIYRGNTFDFNLVTVFINVGYTLSAILTRDPLDYNAFDRYYTMYRISIPFILIGFVDCTKHVVIHLRKREEAIDLSLFLWAAFCIYFICGWFLGLEDPPNVNKMNGIFFAQFFLLIWGIRKVVEWGKKRNKKLTRVGIALLCSVYLFDAASFLQYYFVQYVTDIYPQIIFFDTYEKIIDHLYENDMENRTIYIMGSVYTCFDLSMIGRDEILLEQQKEYKNYRFYAPEVIDPHAVYIIPDTYEMWNTLLLEAGLNVQCEDGMYRCYYSDTSE